MDQICTKRVFQVENRKSEHHQWTHHVPIILGTKCQLKLTILFFWSKCAQKRYCCSKPENVNNTTEFYIFELTGPNLPEKVLSVENWKYEQHHWILSIPIFLDIKFQLKLTILIFLDQICPKSMFLFKNRRSEHHKWILHIWISLGTKFQLKLNIDFLDQICSKMSSLKQTKWTQPLNFDIRISLGTKFQLALAI